MYLESFFSYGSYLAEVVCLAFAGLACWRLSKLLREKWFSMAAWALAAFVGLEVLHTVMGEVFRLVPAIRPVQRHADLLQVYRLAALCLFVFFVTFSAGAVHRGIIARKPATSPPAPAAPEV